MDDLSLAHIGANSLDAEQLKVVRYVIIHELTETQAAALLTGLSDRVYSRDRVHRILLTSLARMRRAIEAHLDSGAVAA